MAAPANGGNRGRSAMEFTNFGRAGSGPVAPPTLPVVFGRLPSPPPSLPASASAPSPPAAAAAAASGSSAGARIESSSTRPSAWLSRNTPGALPTGSSVHFPPSLHQPYSVQSQPRLPANAGIFLPELRQNSAPSSITSPLRGGGEGEADKRSSVVRGMDRQRSGAASAKEPSIRVSKPNSDSERDREEQAKARRLLRFNFTGSSEAGMGSTNQPRIGYNKSKVKGGSQEFQIESNMDIKTKGVNRDKKMRASIEEATELRQRERTPDGMSDPEVSDSFADEKDWHLAEPILGTCSEMCPESEQLERERKGDLDRFERLDGEKNQTSTDLAVKKYTRTAEREPSLIRPLPVLQMTMQHLLGLLERCYDNELLGLYNFLWDRMRAIRMDLRMQHIFNVEAIAMHEQMIRFHILAMHELCEYSNYGGHSEGFDGHLNIEQMNKASVDLFQMYMEHIRRGTPVPSEAEFRGYYALLKLDKHPGHFVEPAELSMDLAKMNPALRNSPEVLFAREVARSCRTGNYIVFFRLARRATYLQACLMHAHFSKLRTHALASLYSGLQKNQGIPVSQVAEWLGMEGDETVELLDHHGFLIREFEEPYMVKAGPFLNSHVNVQTRRSELVILKCSRMVIDDVKFQGRAIEIKNLLSDRPPATAFERIGVAARSWGGFEGGGFVIPEEEMPDYEEEEQPDEQPCDKDSDMQDDYTLYAEDEPQPSKTLVDQERESYLEAERIMREYHELDAEHQKEPHALRKRKMELPFETEEQETNKHFKRGESFKELRSLKSVKMLQDAQDSINAASRHTADEDVNASAHLQEDEDTNALHEVEAIAGRVRFWLRRWRLRTSVKIEDERHKKERAEAALHRIALGPPLREIIWRTGNKGNTNVAADGTVTHLEFDLNDIAEKRNLKIKEMWTKLDVSSVVAHVLKEKNPQARCICWKLVICSRLQDKDLGFEVRDHTENLAGQWLKIKLFTGRHSHINDLFQSEIAVTNDIIECRSESESGGKSFLYYIAQDLSFISKRPHNEAGVYGANGLVFLLLQSLPIDEERARLHAMVESVPSGSCLPLLILVTQSMVRNAFTFEHANKSNDDYFGSSLQLDQLDKSKVTCWLILPVTDQGGLPNDNNGSLISDNHRRLSNLLKDDARSRVHVPMNFGTSVRGFFENKTLIEGLRWLASKAPAAPNLRSVHVQDLVLEYLEPHLRLLMTMHPSSISPEIFIAIFNRSLESAIKEIKLSASSSIPHWPPPELGDCSEEAERDFLHTYLPYLGWNDPATLQPILDALQSSKLPPFPNFTLKHCSRLETNYLLAMANKAPSKHGMIDEIQNQQLVILNTFVQYISQLGEESWSIVQQVKWIIEKSSILDWTETGCVVIPRWAYLFQLVYQTRLSFLNSEHTPIVCVSHKNSVAPERDEYEKSISVAQRVWGASPPLFSLWSSSAG